MAIQLKPIQFHKLMHQLSIFQIFKGDLGIKIIPLSSLMLPTQVANHNLVYKAGTGATSLPAEHGLKQHPARGKSAENLPVTTASPATTASAQTHVTIKTATLTIQPHTRASCQRTPASLHSFQSISQVFSARETPSQSYRSTFPTTPKLEVL